MAKLYFKYGTMKSGKSIDLIKAYINYELSGREVLVIKPAIDDRTANKVSSRLGRSVDANLVLGDSDDEIKSIMIERGRAGKRTDVILVDEAQFLTKTTIKEFVEIVDDMGIPVVCWGLKSNFKGELFDGTKLLFELADKLEEIKTICEFCDSKSTMNLRANTVNGDLYAVPLTGDVIQIGDEEYIQVCRNHYFEYVSGETIIPYHQHKSVFNKD